VTGFHFDISRFFPRNLFDAITETRVCRPEVILAEARARKRRTRLTRDGKLSILAGDHAARGALKVLQEPLRMANRYEYLGRLLRVVLHPAFDGVMAPPDILEDMLIVNCLLKERGAPSFLDEKVMIGCMQRGGVNGVSGEIDDRFSAYTAASLAEFNMDGGKMLIRAVDEDERTLKTIDYCANAVTDLRRHGLSAFIEPLPQKMADGKYTANYTIDSLSKYVCVCSALGDSSCNTWLKVPYISEFQKIAGGTTLPILVLGGEARVDPIPLLKDISNGMQASPNVRGVMVGRNVLYPGGDDPLAFALAVNRVVHQGVDWEESVKDFERDRGSDADALFRWFA
jgi:DhnA family fructose-bisphosphate aldolase class Ia